MLSYNHADPSSEATSKLGLVTLALLILTAAGCDASAAHEAPEPLDDGWPVGSATAAGFDAEGLAKGLELADYGLKPGELTELKRLFEHATTFGSLIQVPEELAEKLPALRGLAGWQSPEQDTIDWELDSALGGYASTIDRPPAGVPVA